MMSRILIGVSTQERLALRIFRFVAARVQVAAISHLSSWTKGLLIQGTTGLTEYRLLSAREKEATPNGSLSTTNHWQEPTRLEIDASSNSQRRETVDDRRSYHNRRACVSGGVFSDYAALHL